MLEASLKERFFPGRVTYIIDRNGTLGDMFSRQKGPGRHVDEAVGAIKSICENEEREKRGDRLPSPRDHELALQLFLVWYFVIGFFLGNGVPHFTFGAAGKVFRSPFGQKSSPRTNILWGLSNFVGATILAGALAFLNLYGDWAFASLLIGFWLTMLMFGTGIKRFLNDSSNSQNEGSSARGHMRWGAG